MPYPTLSSTGGPIFFWREYEEPYGFLSQWYSGTFTAPSPSSSGAVPMTFVTTEQYMYVVFSHPRSLSCIKSLAMRRIVGALSLFTPEMTTLIVIFCSRMYHKAILFDDQEIADEIKLEPMPSKQKALGRGVRGFDGKRWNAEREKVVEEGNWWKFNKSKEGDLRKMLLETGDRLLVEASPYDRIWGVGYSAATAAANRGDWGQNLLGKALMRVRDRLHTEEAKSMDEVGEKSKVEV